MSTVQQIIDRARVRHPAFYELAMPDGAALLFVTERARTLLLRHAEDLEGLLTQTIEVAASTVDESTGYALPADTVGYAMEFDGDLIRLVDVALIYSDGHTGPVEIIDQRRRHDPGNRLPRAFFAAGCLIPVHAGGVSAERAGDAWSHVTAVQFTGIALPELEELEDDLPWPAGLDEPLTAGLAAMMAQAAGKNIETQDKRDIVTERVAAEAQLAQLASEMVRASTTNSVVYRG